MKRAALLAVCLAVTLGGCDSGLLPGSKKPDIVFRCRAVAAGTGTGRVVKYKPIEVVKGDVESGMLADDGFLNYTRRLEEDEDVGEIYIFKLWKVRKEDHSTQPEKYPFGFHCEMSVEIELADGKGITG